MTAKGNQSKVRDFWLGRRCELSWRLRLGIVGGFAIIVVAITLLPEFRGPTFTFTFSPEEQDSTSHQRYTASIKNTHHSPISIGPVRFEWRNAQGVTDSSLAFSSLSQLLMPDEVVTTTFLIPREAESFRICVGHGGSVGITRRIRNWLWRLPLERMPTKFIVWLAESESDEATTNPVYYSEWTKN